MGVTPRPTSRPSRETSLGNHEDRIRALERNRTEEDDWCLALAGGTAIGTGGGSPTTDFDLLLAFGSGVDNGTFTQHAGFVQMVQINRPGTYEIRTGFTYTGAWTAGANKYLSAYAYTFTGYATTKDPFGAGKISIDATNRSPLHGNTGLLHWPSDGNTPAGFQTSQIAVQSQQNSGADLTLLIEVYIKRVSDYLLDSATAALWII